MTDSMWRVGLRVWDRVGRRVGSAWDRVGLRVWTRVGRRVGSAWDRVGLRVWTRVADLVRDRLWESLDD